MSITSSTFISYPLKFRPLMKERLWGGSRLASYFQLESHSMIGEVWTLSGHINGPSVCMNGPLAGKSLPEIISYYPEWYLGNTDREEFPLLIKFIHAEQDLSVQIHPDDAYAQKHAGDYGKTEAWYIVEAERKAKINYGHSFPDRHTFEQAVREGRVRDYLRYRKVAADDFIFVPSRTLHAIMEGIMLIEIQQTSDITYRVYDWDRVDKDGNPRQLHTAQAADVLEFERKHRTDERKVVKQMPGVRQEHLIHCPYFTADKWDLSVMQTMSLQKMGQPDILICAKGEGTLSFRGKHSIKMAQGDTLLLPADLETYDIRPEHRMTLLRTTYN